MDQTYMKEKPILPLLLSMALPMVISMFVNSLYNIIDSIFVAKISEDAMTALSVSTDDDDFLTPAWHGRYVKVRANYGYGIRSKWSEAEMIGCGKLHLHQDFNNLTSK